MSPEERRSFLDLARRAREGDEAARGAIAAWVPWPAENATRSAGRARRAGLARISKQTQALLTIPPGPRAPDLTQVPERFRDVALRQINTQVLGATDRCLVVSHFGTVAGIGLDDLSLRWSTSVAEDWNEMLFTFAFRGGDALLPNDRSLVLRDVETWDLIERVDLPLPPSPTARLGHVIADGDRGLVVVDDVDGESLIGLDIGASFGRVLWTREHFAKDVTLRFGLLPSACGTVYGRSHSGTIELIELEHGRTLWTTQLAPDKPRGPDPAHWAKLEAADLRGVIVNDPLQRQSSPHEIFELDAQRGEKRWTDGEIGEGFSALGEDVAVRTGWRSSLGSECLRVLDRSSGSALWELELPCPVMALALADRVVYVGLLDQHEMRVRAHSLENGELRFETLVPGAVSPSPPLCDLIPLERALIVVLSYPLGAVSVTRFDE